MGYGEIIRVIKEAPLTQLPAILMTTVETCVERKVFVDGSNLIKIVSKVVKKVEF